MAVHEYGWHSGLDGHCPLISGAAIILSGYFNGLSVLTAMVGMAAIFLDYWMAKLGSVLTDRTSSDEDIIAGVG